LFSGNGRLCDADTWKAFGLIHFPDQDDDEDDADIDQVKQGSFFWISLNLSTRSM